MNIQKKKKQQFFISNFFECLAKIKGVKIPEYAGKAFAKALRAPKKYLKRLEPLKPQIIKGFSLFLKILGFVYISLQTV